MIEVAKHYSIEFMSKEGKSVNTLDKKCSLIIPLAENPDILIKDIKERKYPENVILIIKHTEDILQNTDSPFSSSEALKAIKELMNMVFLTCLKTIKLN